MAGRGRRAPGELENAIMNILQDADDALSVAEVRRRTGGHLAYTTVQTILTRMLNKGVLVRLPSGRGHVYTPVADPSGLAARRMCEAMESGTDRKAVLSHFLGSLSESDEAMLRDLLGRS
ncbi:BlaI/MecI/CopY family transcriptional regulator [Actinomadura nitritigenes]|uniref:BlaI/MecI/CopY family transcriptional regulator n=1 Tax=Actinomadura nitritigenes TaxID=134602 RepID=UPI003D93406D